MKIKKFYIKPQVRTHILHGSALMTYGSNTVNDYDEEEEVTFGEE